jgi:hypothetical protein
MLAALLFLQAISSPAPAPAKPVITQTPAAAMDYLVRTLPHVKTFDAWEGGWGEAPLDRAKFNEPCELATTAPFEHLYYDSGETREAAARQNWTLDFSNITSVGQVGTRAGYKVADEPKLILGFVAKDPETARGIAVALETMRLACTQGAVTGQ